MDNLLPRQALSGKQLLSLQSFGLTWATGRNTRNISIKRTVVLLITTILYYIYIYICCKMNQDFGCFLWHVLNPKWFQYITLIKVRNLTRGYVLYIPLTRNYIFSFYLMSLFIRTRNINVSVNAPVLASWQTFNLYFTYYSSSKLQASKTQDSTFPVMPLNSIFSSDPLCLVKAQIFC